MQLRRYQEPTTSREDGLPVRWLEASSTRSPPQRASAPAEQPPPPKKRAKSGARSHPPEHRRRSPAAHLRGGETGPGAVQGPKKRWRRGGAPRRLVATNRIGPPLRAFTPPSHRDPNWGKGSPSRTIPRSDPGVRSGGRDPGQAASAVSVASPTASRTCCSRRSRSSDSSSSRARTRSRPWPRVSSA